MRAEGRTSDEAAAVVRELSKIVDRALANAHLLRANHDDLDDILGPNPAPPRGADHITIH